MHAICELWWLFATIPYVRSISVVEILPSTLDRFHLEALYFQVSVCHSGVEQLDLTERLLVPPIEYELLKQCHQEYRCT